MSEEPPARFGCAKTLQGLDTEEDVMAPKVVEALLGTRFQGRDFVKAPLVRAWRPQKCLLL